MSLTGTIIKRVGQRAAGRFDAYAADPAGTQHAKLFSMLERNAHTEYGRRYDFASMRTIEDYQKRVPTVTYDDIREDMERVTEGTRNVFTADDPIMFAQTSGTTGKPKFIPVTKTCRGREHKDVMRAWLYHAQCAHPTMWDGKIVTLVSPAVEGHTPAGLPFGSTSGDIYRNQPPPVRRLYSTPYDVFEIDDYSAKYYVIMRMALEHDIRFLATANPSSILKMCEKANDYADDIIRDVRDGTLSDSYDIKPEIRARIGKRFRANPAQARRLEEARSRRDGSLMPADYWPRLALIGCWKGGTVGHYIDKLQRWFDPDGTGPVAVRDWGYLSSECRGSIPLSDEGSEGVLTIGSAFFEFVEVDALEANREDPSSWPYRTVADVEDGKAYYIFVTTTGGLYRYDINDIIEVRGRYKETPQIVFLRKGRGMTNITGEKLSVNQIITAVERVADELGALPGHFKAEADPGNSRYVLRVEFANRVDADTRRRFLAAFDGKLKSINIEYKAKRDSQRLRAPVLHVMREGWYERNRKAQVAGGHRAFQAKTELLSPMKMQTMEVKPEVEEVVELE